MLSAHQIEVLRAAVNRIIPLDDFPAGWEAGVGDYFMRQFEGDLKDLLDTYRVGLDALDAESQAVIGTEFARASTEEQDSLLSQIEQNKVKATWPLDAAGFFNLLVDHAMEGFYSDPGNGGNRDQIAWKMIGFEVRG
jgi:gluconate 2-dehydrogenase gamma chain